MMKYDYYFADESGDGHFHKDAYCELLEPTLCGDMTGLAAIQATEDEDDIDPCPECVLQ